MLLLLLMVMSSLFTQEQHIYGDVLLDLNPRHLLELRILDPSHQVGHGYRAVSDDATARG